MCGVALHSGLMVIGEEHLPAKQLAEREHIRLSDYFARHGTRLSSHDAALARDAAQAIVDASHEASGGEPRTLPELAPAGVGAMVSVVTSDYLDALAEHPSAVRDDRAAWLADHLAALRRSLSG